jgi:uncharacterized protein DUF1902
MHYRYGWPMGHLLAKAGVPTKIRVDVIRDDEAGVFVGTSTDVRGLVIEAESLEGVMRETQAVIHALVSSPSKLSPDTVTDVRYRDRLCHA